MLVTLRGAKPNTHIFLFLYIWFAIHHSFRCRYWVAQISILRRFLFIVVMEITIVA